MGRRVLIVLGIFILLSSLLAAAPAAAAGPGRPSHMPPSEDLIIKALRARGVIPADATAEQAEAIYQDYIHQKLAKGNDRPNPLGAAAIRTGEASGKPQNNHGRVMRPNNQRFDNVLTVLIEFAGSDTYEVPCAGGVEPPCTVTATGPLHNEMAAPAADDNTTYWVPDFGREHYQKMLFSRAPGARTMANYYLEQSSGTYTVDGQVYGWVQLPHSEAWYGADSATGTDDLNGPVWRVVQDAVAAAGTSIPWAQFDQEDPYDLDGDGNYAEPDGYVDHVQFVHAGADQSGGGGAQGDDAIWAHSWWVDYREGVGPGLGGVQTADPNVWVGPYTIQSEDGTIGVFCHEFGHDLGLPDLYDTIYSGEASPAFWTLMASGSWLACPGEALGTCPAGMGAWEKYVMGWLKPLVVNPGQLKDNVTLRNAVAAGPAQKAIRVNLPDYTYQFSVNTPHGGSYEWYSGKGDNLNNTLTRDVAVPAGGAQLSFWTWYDTEVGYDYGYVQVSSDGTSWTDLDTYNGNSGGWVLKTYSLPAGTVKLRFYYYTDPGVQGLGWAIDDITLGDFSDDVEGGNQGWTANGWYIFAGTADVNAFHYYMAEWRAPKGFDVSLTNWYNFVYGNSAQFLSATPGMLLWYRNGQYADNWVGVHPGYGRLLVVDSHPTLLRQGSTGRPLRTRLQVADAAFARWATIPIEITAFGATVAHGPFPGVPVFDDSLSYFDPEFHDSGGAQAIRTNAVASAITPHYGLKITVKSGTPTAGMVRVDFRGFHMPE